MLPSETTAAESAATHSALGPDLTPGQLQEVLALRVAVFVVEQECPYQEVDGRDLDADTLHMWIEDDDGIAAYIRILADPDHGSEAVKIGRVVTRSDCRGRQLSASLIRSALQELPGAESRLEAQSHLVGYYRTFGYEPSGPEYIEDGIPHTPMTRPGAPS